ncbi:MAG: DUF4358 domain-containing protein [Clostridia bacterium]
MKKIIAIVLALVVIGVGAYFMFFASTGDAQTETTQTTQVVEDEAAASGLLSAAHQGVVDYFGEFYAATGDVPAENAEALFGLDLSLAAEYIIQMPMISVQNDLFIGIEVTDGNIDAVVAALNAYRENLVSDMMQYPTNLIKSNASRVIVIDNYAFLLVLGTIDDTLTDDDAQLANITAQMDEVEAIINAALLG